MRMKKIMVAVLTLAMLATGMFGNGTAMKAEGSENSVIEFSEDDFNLEVKAGETTRIRLPIKTNGVYIDKPVVKIEDPNANSPFTISKPTLIAENNLPVIFLTNALTVYVDFDVRTKETAEIGTYPLTLKISGESAFDQSSIESSLQFNLRILEEKAPAQLTIRNVTYRNAMPGNDTMLSFVIKNEGEITARNTYLNISFGDTGIINRYTATNVKIGEIAPGKEQAVTLPISFLTTATAGKKILPVNFKYKDIDGTESTSAYNIYVDVQTNEDAPNLDIDSIDYPEGLKPGDAFVLTATLHNFGEAKAFNVSASIDEAGSVGFIKNYLTDDIKASDIKTDGSVKIKIPLTVSKDAAGDLNKLVLNLNYQDSLEVPYNKTKTLYLKVVTPETVKENIIISNVRQFPARPVAGDSLKLSFDFENKGTVDITELKISLPGLAGNTFIPVDSKPYIYIEKVAAGEVKNITIPLTISKNILEGLNNLKVQYIFDGGNGEVDIPVLDVQNDLGSSSKPKLIVSKYETDLEELRAGSIFNFTFELRNTHSSVPAKNITLKVSSSSQGQSGQTEVFSVTQGSNSFFISKIDPGETILNTLELKIKSDAATAAYPIYITMEYEYDGIEPNPTTGEIGETKTEELTLQVVENSRPVVDYVNVYSWDGNVTVGNPATLAFEFYNMGKSMLNNVIATVEGDFTNSSGNMYFMGNVPAGDRSYAEFEVIPNVEGMAKGVVRITFEDSNGEEVEYIKEFEANVMGAQIWDPGVIDGGVDVFNPTVPTVKKEILPKWLFILVEIVIFIAFIPITRKIIITVYRNKLRKQEEENY